MDAALKNALRQREELTAKVVDAERQIAELRDAVQKRRAELTDIEGFIEQWYRLAGQEPPRDTGDDGVALVSPPVRRNINPDRDFVANKALALIEAEGRPLSRRELFQKLNEADVKIYGKDPEMVLSTMLWRSSDRIARLRKHGYWPKDKPYPPAGYDPEVDDLIGVAEDQPE